MHPLGLLGVRIMPIIEIAGREVGESKPPYVIAELSANHNGSLETALQLITAAKTAGADAVKIQTYTPDTITLDCASDDFQIKEGLWRGRTLHDLYTETHLPWDWHRNLFDHARRLGITIFSSPFDASAVDFLEDLNVPAYKIASFEVIDLPLIRYAAKTGKPLIISTGLADEEEISEAVTAAYGAGCKDLALLHCVSGYPAPAEQCNLRTIPDLRTRFRSVVGLSDHTIDNTTAIAGIALGASIIEKHFTLDRSANGPDDPFSLEPAEFTQLCSSALTAWNSLGKVDYNVKECERGNKIFRRSLYFVKDLRAGDTLTPDAVRSVRPGYGLSPKFYDSLIGRRLCRDVFRNTPVKGTEFLR